MPVLVRPDVRLNYQLVGPPPGIGAKTPVVMIHGLGANLAFWYLGAVRHMGRDVPLVLPDLRGHGASSMPPSGYALDQMAEDVRALMDELRLERVHLVGHSHGGRVALALALRHPDRIASLTIADTQLRDCQPPMRLKDWPHWPEWREQLSQQGVTSFPPDEAEIDFRLLAELGPRGAGVLAGSTDGARAGHGHPLAATARRAVLAREGETMPPRRRGINLRSRQMGARGSRKWHELLETTTAGTEMHDESAVEVARLPQLQMPMLLIYGAKSHCMPTSEALLHLVPGARRIVVPGAGHFFPIAKPRFFSLALRTFIAGIERPGPAAARRSAARHAGRPVLRAAKRMRTFGG